MQIQISQLQNKREKSEGNNRKQCEEQIGELKKRKTEQSKGIDSLKKKFT